MTPLATSAQACWTPVLETILSIVGFLMAGLVWLVV